MYNFLKGSIEADSTVDQTSNNLTEVNVLKLDPNNSPLYCFKRDFNENPVALAQDCNSSQVIK